MGISPRAFDVGSSGGSPLSFTVGGLCVVERADGRVLLVRHGYRPRWGLPGGFLKRGEIPTDGARREVFEEVGLRVELLGEPAVVVSPEWRRVDVVFRARPTRTPTPTWCVPPRWRSGRPAGSPEIRCPNSKRRQPKQ